MKVLVRLAAFLVAMILSCVLYAAEPAASPTHLVRLDGVARAANVSHTYGLVGVRSTPVAGAVKEQPSVVLPARDGDLLFLSSEPPGEGSATFPYAATDGDGLAISFHGPTLMLGDRPVCLILNARSLDFLNHATPADLKSLRMIMVAGELPKGATAALKRLADANPHVGLLVDNAAAIASLLKLFQPRWLLLKELDEDARKALAKQPALECLSLAPTAPADMKLLATLPKLRALMLFQYDAAKVGPIPDGCAALRTLLISPENPTDLAALKPPATLREFHLLGGGEEEALDISALEQLPHLECVSLLVNRVADPAPLERLPNVIWLGMPKLSQKQFDAVVRAHPKLQALDIYQLDGVRSLAALRDLPHLVALTILDKRAGDEAKDLEAFKKLRVLTVIDPQKYRDIAAALPDCRVQEGKVCLGSGWILLLIPAVAAAWLLTRRQAKRRPAAAHHHA